MDFISNVLYCIKGAGNTVTCRERCEPDILCCHYRFLSSTEKTILSDFL